VRPGDAEDELERLMNTKDRVRRKREITVLAANIAELRAQPATKQ
jgi:hypothetical protein